MTPCERGGGKACKQLAQVQVQEGYGDGGAAHQPEELG